ncbi:hypothetical protein D9757_006265 [Collybiopsis confluens]|uniref:ATP-dependent DNA helicase n=1 Tax=Collybiopsis confluens TaxID=2823264 RepID=A0A8H5M843_9AGAR|nr:hypothetical protein D9757_006265 [Collybiopsis confluens]
MPHSLSANFYVQGGRKHISSILNVKAAGAQIQEVPIEVRFSCLVSAPDPKYNFENQVAGHFKVPGFSSKSQAERHIRALEAWREQYPPSQIVTPSRVRAGSRYPNSSSRWEESDSTPPSDPPRIQRITPLPTPELEAQAPAPVVIPQLAQPPQIILSDEQKLVLERVKSGGNVFFTGPAGTGKSVLLRAIIQALRYELNLEVAMTASTGIAGLNVGGSTVHSWAGIGLGKEKAEILASRIARSEIKKYQWQNTNTLIIDESKILYSNRDLILIQLVICGDFCQLPPVPGKSHKHVQPPTFAFEANTWDRCMGKPILLTQVFRQRDRAFVDLLSAMRVGELTTEHIDILASLSRPLKLTDQTEPCSLFATKLEVQACNTNRLNVLGGPSVSYKSMDFRGVDVFGKMMELEDAKVLLDNEVVLREITIKVGAQVMLIQNVVQGSLVNGSVGKVVGFMTSQEALWRKIFITEIKKGRMNDDAPSPQAAVRIETEVILPAEDESEFEQINKHVQFGVTDEWPLVEFSGGVLLLCAPTRFTVEGFMGNVEAKRVQIPLILAWALSMHKSQGQTLEKVRVDLNKVFENGQAYVAISRATSFEDYKIMAEPRVLHWQQTWMPRPINSNAQGVAQAGPFRVPSTPLRQLPSPISNSRPASRPLQRQADPDETLWDEMDSEYSISHYYDNIPK